MYTSKENADLLQGKLMLVMTKQYLIILPENNNNWTLTASDDHQSLPYH